MWSWYPGYTAMIHRDVDVRMRMDIRDSCSHRNVSDILAERSCNKLLYILPVSFLAWWIEWMMTITKHSYPTRENLFYRIWAICATQVRLIFTISTFVLVYYMSLYAHTCSECEELLHCPMAALPGFTFHRILWFSPSAKQKHKYTFQHQQKTQVNSSVDTLERFHLITPQRLWRKVGRLTILGLSFTPVWTFSIFLTLNMLSPGKTLPKTTCLLSRKEVSAVVMKNWDEKIKGRMGEAFSFHCLPYRKKRKEKELTWQPFVFFPLLAILNNPGMTCFASKFSSSNFPP